MKWKSQPQSPMNKSFSWRLFASALIFSTPILFGACGQDYNSNSGDGSFSAVDCSNLANATLCAATEVLEAKCFSCHADMAAYTSSQDYIDSGRVVAGNTAASTMINRLINAGSTMPLGGGALSTAEYNALVAWVTSL
jgi:uncharacterized membrane protein